jgi:hypothetical protein
MQREPPDTHFYAEVRDLNLEFLSLLAAGRRCCIGPVFGLDTAVVDQIARFNPAELDAMAATPCLLAGFGANLGTRTVRIAEPPPAGDPEWGVHARLFAAGLLTYVLQMARRDALLAALCAGSAAGSLAGATGFRDIRGYAERALQHLEARFRRQSRFWPDLVRATRDGRPERLHLARLSAIQLATSETSRPVVPPTPTPALALLARTANTR